MVNKATPNISYDPNSFKLQGAGQGGVILKSTTPRNPYGYIVATSVTQREEGPFGLQEKKYTTITLRDATGQFIGTKKHVTDVDGSNHRIFNEQTKKWEKQ